MKSSTNRTLPRPIQSGEKKAKKALKYAVWGGAGAWCKRATVRVWRVMCDVCV